MQECDPFPIEQLPPRIKNAVLSEFKGRCPTILEVVSTPDAHWLSGPNMGHTSLARLRSVTRGMRRKVGIPTLSGLPDAELLSRTRHLEKQFKQLCDQLKAHRDEVRMRGISRPHFRIKARGL
jgi:hypothetical protein